MIIAIFKYVNEYNSALNIKSKFKAGLTCVYLFVKLARLSLRYEGNAYFKNVNVLYMVYIPQMWQSKEMSFVSFSYILQKLN